MAVDTLEANGTELDTAFSETLIAARERADAVELENPASLLDDEGNPITEDPAPAVDPEAASGEPDEAADAGPAKPVGLSPQILRLAINAKIPQSLIDSARDDAQLAEFVEKFGGLDSEDEEDAAEETLGQQLAKKLFNEALDIPEDEYDATDPAHRRIRALAQNQRLMAEAVGKTFDATQKVDKSVKNDREAQFHAALVSDYDGGIDELGYEDTKSSDAERTEAWPLFQQMVAAYPNTPRRVLAQRAFHATHPGRLKGAAERKQLEALKGQEKTKLGGGPAKPAPVKELEGPDAIKADIRKFIARAAKVGK